MNRKEVNEIRRGISKNGLLTVEYIHTAFVDAEKNIAHSETRPYALLDESEYTVCINTLKKVISNNVGKNFIEYEFPKTAYETNGAQYMLYNLLSTKLQDVDITADYVDHIAQNLSISEPYMIMTAYCTYTVFKKDRADEDDKYNEELFNFIVTAICPAHTCDCGFVFTDIGLVKKVNSELIVSQIPVGGFMYPVFSDRSADINHVMYYSKSSKELNISMIEDVLGCEFTLSPEQERINFHHIISDIMGNDLSYQLIQTINDVIITKIYENSNNTEPLLLDSYTIKDILLECYVDEKLLVSVHDIYKKYCGSASLFAFNLIDKKFVINASGISVKVPVHSPGRIRPSVVDGRKRLVIDVEESSVDINGFEVPIN